MSTKEQTPLDLAGKLRSWHLANAGNGMNGQFFGAVADELDRLNREVERLTDLNNLYVQQNGDNADDNVVLRNRNRQQFAALTAANARAERYKGGLEICAAMVMVHDIPPMWEVRDVAIMALADDAKEGERVKKTKPLDDLEMFELLRAAYPEKFKDDEDETWDTAQHFADELSGWQDVADLLGRVVMMTMPMESGITGRKYHCLGTVTITDGEAQMVAAVRRDAKEGM